MFSFEIKKVSRIEGNNAHILGIMIVIILERSQYLIHIALFKDHCVRKLWDKHRQSSPWLCKCYILILLDILAPKTTNLFRCIKSYFGMR